MSLVADYSSSSESATSSEAENTQNSEFSEKLKLPSADALLSSGKPGEVFNNPYKEAENAKIALLEKHVKMVSTEEHLREKNGKKICWNYRKGRCRFGSNCTFAHDSDLYNPENDNLLTEIPCSSQRNDIPLMPTISKPQHGLQIGTSNTKSINSSLLKSTDNKSTTKRSRSGLGDSIVPGKKVMKSYSAQKKKLS